MITVKQIKSLVLKRVNKEFNPIGFKSGKDNYYYICTKDYIISFKLTFFTYCIELRYLDISIKYVEDILRKIEEENESPWNDNISIAEQYKNTISEENESYRFDLLDIYYLEELEKLADELILRIKDLLGGFFKKYIHLPNIVRCINKSEVENSSWIEGKYGILSSFLDAYLRGLIISKLCNDPNFDDKVKHVDYILYEKYPHRTEYHPYYERLKKLLETLEPVCSMDTPNPFENVDMMEYLKQQHYEYQAMIEKDKPKKKSSDEVLSPEKATKLFKSKIKESLDIQAFKRATKRDIPSITVYGKEQCYGVATFSFETTDKGNIIPHPISIYLTELEEIMGQITYPGKDIPREGIPYTQKDELSPEILEYLEKEQTPPTEDSITELAELVSDYIDNSEDYVTYNADILNLYEEAHGEGFWFEYLYGNCTEEKLLRAVTYLVLSGNTDCLQDELPNYKILLTGDWDTSLRQLRQVLADRGYEVWED